MALNKERHKVLIQSFDELSDIQKKKDFLKSLKIKSPVISNNQFISETKESFLRKNTKKIVCPFCGSILVVKNGTKDGKQRFVCKTCKKTFDYAENTILKD